MVSSRRAKPRALARLLVLAAVMLFLPTACVGPRPPEGKILIEFWDFPRLPLVEKWLRDAIDTYQQAHPEVHIVYTKLSWSKGGERMDIAAFAGRSPDVAGAVLKLKYAEAGLLEPLDQYLDEPIAPGSDTTWREDIYPHILESVQWSDRTWAFPWYKEAFVLLLNNDILRERGVPPPTNGKWTWDEFLTAMRQLTFDRNGDGRIDVYGVGFNTGNEKWEAYPFLFAEGMKLLSEDGRTMLIDSPETRRGINRLMEMEFVEKVSLPGAGGIMDDATWTAFQGRERTLASTAQGLWAINSVRISNQRLQEKLNEGVPASDLPRPLDVSIALFPQMPGQPQVMASYGVGSLMVFKRKDAPERTEAAARFARYLTLEAGQQVNRVAGLMPSRISTGNLFEDDPLYRDIMPYIPDAITPPVHPVWQQLDQVIGENLQRILLREIDVETGVTRMGRQGQMILDDYWQARDAEVGGS